MPSAWTEWFIGDFLPFGDLVSDIWLWSTLPQDRPDNYNCTDRMYTVRRYAGTLHKYIRAVQGRDCVG